MASHVLVTDAKKNDPCDSPCSRCLDAYARGEIDDHHGECCFSTRKILTKQFSFMGKPFNRCQRCVPNAEKCFKLPGDYDDFLKELNKLIQAWRDAPEAEKAAKKAEVAAEAKLIIRALRGTHQPYANNLFAHDGLSMGDQSGVLLDGRDRSAGNVVKQSKRKAAELLGEVEDEAPPVFGTPKKMRGGVVGLAETPKEAAERLTREENERATKEAQKKAAAAARKKAGAAGPRGGAKKAGPTRGGRNTANSGRARFDEDFDEDLVFER